MDYKKEICPVCQKEFCDGDDIVVCPECGTPHHRECWAVNNHCANEALHSESFEWQKSAVERAEPHFEPVNENEPQNQSEPVGNTNAPFSMPVVDAQGLNEDGFQALCMRGVNADKDEKIDGARIGDIAFFIQQNARHYINKFIKNKKITFNWAALLFAPAWFFYRKLYKAGAVFLALSVAISLFTYPLQTKIENELPEMYESIGIDYGDEDLTRQDVYEAIEEVGEQKAISIMLPYLQKTALILALNILPNLIAAFCANEIYKRKIKKDLGIIYETTEDLSARRMLIMQRGGVSFFIGGLVFIAADYIVPMLMSAGNYFMDLF